MELEKKRVLQMMRNLTLQQIYTFFRAVEYENLTWAARDLNLSQAAVSRMIANMENELGLILFVRKARGTEPTPAAKILYENWRKAFRSMEGSYEAAYRAQLGYIKRFRFGVVSFEQELTPHIALARWFEEKYPHIDLSIEYKTVDELFSEGLIHDLPEKSCRQLRVSEFDSGLSMVWNGDSTPLLRDIAGFLERFHAER